MKIFKLPCKRNCCILAVMHQLGQSFMMAHALRVEVAQYLQLNVLLYHPAILASCHFTYSPEIIQNTSSIELVLRYMSDLKQNGFLCGPECVHAICNIKQIKINVYFFKRPEVVTFKPISGHYITEINLLTYKRHYYSIVVE